MSHRRLQQLTAGVCLHLLLIHSFLGGKIAFAQSELVVEELLESGVVEADTEADTNEMSPQAAEDTVALDTQTNQNSEDLTTEYVASVSATTGENTVDESNNTEQLANGLITSRAESSQTASTSANLKTGDVTVSVQLAQESNTTIHGKDWQFLVSTYFEKVIESLNFSSESLECTTASEPRAEILELQQEVYSRVLLDLSAQTGSNTIENSTAAYVKTGDAQVRADIWQLINTALVGDCWLFGSITLFEGGEGDIVLPQVANVTQQHSSQSAVVEPSSTTKISPEVRISQSSDTTQEVSVAVSSGETSVHTAGDSQITTGTTSAQTQVTTITNTSIVGSEWFLLQIINPWYWSGTFVGLEFEPVKITDANSTYYWWQALPSNQAYSSAEETQSSEKIEIVQVSDVQIAVASTAQTGGNSVTATSAQVETGTASSATNIFQMLNTAVVGSHWYFVTLALFDTFSGNIVFVQPQLLQPQQEPPQTESQPENTTVSEQLVTQVTQSKQEQQQDEQPPIAVARSEDPLAVGSHNFSVAQLSVSQKMPVTSFTSHRSEFSNTVSNKSERVLGIHWENFPKNEPRDSWCTQHLPWCETIGWVAGVGPLGLIGWWKRRLV